MHEPTRPKTRTKVLAILANKNIQPTLYHYFWPHLTSGDSFSLADCMPLTKCIWA